MRGGRSRRQWKTSAAEVCGVAMSSPVSGRSATTRSGEETIAGGTAQSGERQFFGHSGFAGDPRSGFGVSGELGHSAGQQPFLHFGVGELGVCGGWMRLGASDCAAATLHTGV